MCGEQISPAQFNNFQGECPHCVRLRKFPAHAIDSSATPQILNGIDKKFNICAFCENPATHRCQNCQAYVCSRHSKVHQAIGKHGKPLLLCDTCGKEHESARNILNDFSCVLLLVLFIALGL